MASWRRKHSKIRNIFWCFECANGYVSILFELWGFIKVWVHEMWLKYSLNFQQYKIKSMIVDWFLSDWGCHTHNILLLWPICVQVIVVRTWLFLYFARFLTFARKIAVYLLFLLLVPLKSSWNHENIVKISFLNLFLNLSLIFLMW